MKLGRVVKYILVIVFILAEPTWSSSLKKFFKNCSIISDEKETCLSLEPSYYFWLLKYKSREVAVVCLFIQLKNKELSNEQRNQHFLLLYTLLDSKKCSKQALKLVDLREKVALSRSWDFLGAFQIGKQEIDGNPVFNQDAIENRWNKKFKAYSELVKTGVVRWKKLSKSIRDNGIQLMPDVEWNDLVMSMQSMGITEWQGMLVNDFLVSAQDVHAKVQCLGVSHFYINNRILNGDLYRREEYWNPIKLDAGIHTLLVPVRAKGPGLVQCFIKTPPKNKRILFHVDKILQPDFIDGNIFSSLVSIPVSNLDDKTMYKLISISTTMNALPGFASVDLSIFNTFSIMPGQMSTLQLNITNKDSQTQQTKCPKKPILLKVRLEFSGAFVEDFSIKFRCRSSKQSFLFTFTDHDGSIQHAASIKPLKPCLKEKCPVLLTMHGTGVSAESQADSYKHMVKKKFVFGVEKMWVLAPTRHGAHNWEGPGEKTSLSALMNLASLTIGKALWHDGKIADENVVIFAGHSMGGHGSWQLSTHHPDKAIAVISAAGWLSKEDYGDSNLFYRHDVSISHTDPHIKMIQESCISENHNDKHAFNLKGLPVFMRIGDVDRTVHPYYSRRMFRLLKENDVDVEYQEIPGKEHWWWDTVKENDGGVSNDEKIRKFIRKVVEEYESSDGYCPKDGCKTGTERSDKYKKKSKRTRKSGHFNFVVYNPASFSGGRGVLIVQQDKPLRKSSYDITISQDDVVLVTWNIRRIRIYEPNNEPINWLEKKKITIDNSIIEVKGPLPWELCKGQIDTWEQCNETDEERSYLSYGPARRITEKEFVIAICDNDDQIDTNINEMKHAAVFLSNLFHLTSNAFAPIKVSRDVNKDEELGGKNVILIGTHDCVNKMKVTSPIRFEENGSASLGTCHFTSKNISAIYLTPKTDQSLLLVLSSNDAASMTRDVLKLAIPTIPPMARSPFSNLLPDYVIFTSDIHKKGPGSYLCSGFWDNSWNFDSTISSCFC